MKKTLFVICFFIIKASILAQTQYDYYDDDVAPGGTSTDGYAILGLIVLVIIGFVVWFICACIKDWVNNHIDTTPKVKAPKPKSSLEIMKEEAEKARRKRVLEWNAMVEEKLRAEAIEILKNEYSEPHIMDNVIYVLKYDTLEEDNIRAFVKGYIWGSYRTYSRLTLEEVKKRFHPIVVLGYIRGLQEEKKVWEKFGEFPG